MNTTRFRRLSGLLLLLSASLLAPGCASSGTSLREVVHDINATLEAGPTLLLSGDTIEVNFTERPDWALSAPVRPDGHASFSHVGDVEVAGLSVADVEARLRESYALVFPQLEVSVGVTLLAQRNVYVMGEVQRPGELPINGRLTLLEALAMAGGPIKRTALLQNTLLVRWCAGEKRILAWRIDAEVEHWGDSSPLLLQPHDVIFVPNKPIDDANIWVDQYIRQMIPIPFIIPTG